LLCFCILILFLKTNFIRFHGDVSSRGLLPQHYTASQVTKTHGVARTLPQNCTVSQVYYHNTARPHRYITTLHCVTCILPQHYTASHAYYHNPTSVTGILQYRASRVHYHTTHHYRYTTTTLHGVTGILPQHCTASQPRRPRLEAYIAIPFFIMYSVPRTQRCEGC
jgi:hypothetical protein